MDDVSVAITCPVTAAGKRPLSGHSTAEYIRSQQRGMSEEGSISPMYVCEHCDKMYTKARDLEIHRSYCTA